MKKTNIINCNFDDFYSTRSGAVLYSSNIDANISHCTFSKVFTTAAGACFYILGTSNVNIKSVCCYCCCIYLSGNQNNVWGNAYYVQDSAVNQSFVSSLLCAPTATYRGDSSICIYNSFSRNKNMNFSKCHGYGGGNFCLYYYKTNATFSYSNIQDAADYRAYESPCAVSYLEKINFINSSKCEEVIYPISGKVYLTECIFIQMANTFATSNCVNLIVAVNCKADASVSGLASIVVSNELSNEVATIPDQPCKSVNICPVVSRAVVRHKCPHISRLYSM